MAGETVGFIGLGNMGEGMAANVLAKGHPLIVTGHRRREALDRLVAAGAREVGTPAEMAGLATVIVLCVTGSPEVEVIVEGPDGILSGVRPGTVVIDCTTAEPSSTVRLAAALEARGAHMVDAPMGGTPTGAQTGTLQALVGADDPVLESVRPIIACWAATIVHIGPVGAGHQMKLINNLVSLSYAATYAESHALARAVGISTETYHAVIGGGRLRCGFYDTYMHWVVDRDENAHRFSVSNGDKDLGYALSMAADAGVDLPVGKAAKAQFGDFVAAGGAERFVPMLADFVADANGLPRPD